MFLKSLLQIYHKIIQVTLQLSYLTHLSCFIQNRHQICVFVVGIPLNLSSECLHTLLNLRNRLVSDCRCNLLVVFAMLTQGVYQAAVIFIGPMRFVEQVKYVSSFRIWVFQQMSPENLLMIINLSCRSCAYSFCDPLGICPKLTNCLHKSFFFFLCPGNLLISSEYGQ